MRYLTGILLLLISFVAEAQFYYDNIIDAEELMYRMELYKKNKVHKITATGYDERGVKNTSYNEWQEINNNATQLSLTRREELNFTREQYFFDTSFRLLKIVSQANGINTTSEYFYNSNELISEIKTTSTDSLQEFSSTESLLWFYNTDTVLQKMIRITNNKDSAIYQFITENGWVTEEQYMRFNKVAESVYYYYDDDGNITDIVRYNKKLKKLLPDVMMEYNEQADIIQKITVLSTQNVPDYLTWRYAFNEMGLKTREALYDKNKKLKGRIDYHYTFFP